ncbi:MAG TPA: hypothetical protein VEA59_02945 [Patescibacteria group bacterium]|nr:hypothetical protein [Patescibacteria group bacterium]
MLNVGNPKHVFGFIGFTVLLVIVTTIAAHGHQPPEWWKWFLKLMSTMCTVILVMHALRRKF